MCSPFPLLGSSYPVPPCVCVASLCSLALLGLSTRLSHPSLSLPLSSHLEDEIDYEAQQEEEEEERLKTQTIEGEEGEQRCTTNDAQE